VKELSVAVEYRPDQAGTIETDAWPEQQETQYQL
jgi:hypothetical protein